MPREGACEERMMKLGGTYCKPNSVNSDLEMGGGGVQPEFQLDRRMIMNRFVIVEIHFPCASWIPHLVRNDFVPALQIFFRIFLCLR